MSEPMKAGRELDALVAEKVMGLIADRDWPMMSAGGSDFWYEPELGDYRTSIGIEPDRIEDYLERDVAVRVMVDGEFRMRETCPAYSTRIEAAWQVMEKMYELGWLCDLFRNQAMPHWHVAFAHDHEDAFANEESAPLAICKAALEAVNKRTPVVALVHDPKENADG